MNEPILLKQYKLLGAIIDAPWATRLDHKIARHVIERYFAKYGNARASLRYLEEATGAERNKIIPSLRRIIEHGAISIIRQGAGTRPTEYDLNFDFGKPSSGASEGTSTSGAREGTSGGAVDGTSKGPSGAREGTQTYLRNMPTGMFTVGTPEGTPAVPAAPPVSGLEADTAASAVAPKAANPFEELWSAFPRKHQIAKARAAYKALGPDHELHARLVSSATELAAHYEKTKTERKWWKHLHTWLLEERFLEDLPEPYESPRDAAMGRSRRTSTTATSEPLALETSLGLSPKTPQGRHRVTVLNAEIPSNKGESEQLFRFQFQIEGGVHQGKEFTHCFKLLATDECEQESGQAFYANLREATGILEPDDTSDFHGASLMAVVSQMGRIEYRAL